MGDDILGVKFKLFLRQGYIKLLRRIKFVYYLLLDSKERHDRYILEVELLNIFFKLI